MPNNFNYYIEEYLYRKGDRDYYKECCDETKALCHKAKSKSEYLSARKDYRAALEDYVDADRYAKQAKTDAAIAKVVARTTYCRWSLHFAFASIDTDQEYYNALKANEVKAAIAEITEEYD